ncbi:hypothetical protein K440DRAFT_632131 [Wilcoxina mikolae CBS 423.85]|nr:hypothetical protein K440DRAFT_632131 [Wilcoxina mikolae CBS 423.85]
MDRPRHIWKIVRIPYQRDRNMIRQWAREINERHGIPPRSERSWMDVPRELMDEAIKDLEQQLNLEPKFVDGWFYRWLLREARKPTTMEGRGSKTSKATQRLTASASEGGQPAEIPVPVPETPPFPRISIADLLSKEGGNK